MRISGTTQIMMIMEEANGGAERRAASIAQARSRGGPLLIPPEHIGPFLLPLEDAGPKARRVNMAV